METQFVIKDHLGELNLRVLTVQRTVAGSLWNFERMLSPCSRLWLFPGGRATVQHHWHTFELRRGCLHLVPAFTWHDCLCSRRLDHFDLHFPSRVVTGIDLFARLQQEQIIQIKLEAVALDSTIVKVHPDGTRAFKKRPASYRQISERLDHQDSSGCRECPVRFEFRALTR